MGVTKDLLEINKLLSKKLKVGVLEPDPTIFNKLPIELIPQLLSYIHPIAFKINAENNIGTEAFLQAMEMGELNMAGQLAKYGVNLDVKDKEGTTLLMRTIEEEKIREVKFLIKIGADINAQDNLGNTPLHLATGVLCCRGFDLEDGDILTRFNIGNPELTEILIKAGAKVSVKNSIGLSELNCVIHGYENSATLAVLLNSGKYTQNQLIKTLFKVSSSGGSITDLLDTTLEAFKINHVDINAKDTHGFTALDHAINYGEEHNVEALLEAGAHTDYVAENLFKVVSNNRRNPDLLNTILKIKNINVNAKDTHGRTALDYARDSGNKHKIKALLEAGAHSNDNEVTKDTNGWMAPNHVIDYGKEYNVKALLNAGDHTNVNEGSYIKGYIIAQALKPGIKCVTDLVNGNNYDSTCYSYYKNTYDSLSKLTVKAAFSNAVFGFALYQGSSLVNAMIASKVATDAAESIIKGDFYMNPQSYATEMLQYLGKMGVIILASTYVTDEENVLITTTLLNIAPELIDLGSSVIYQGAIVVDEILHPIGEHEDFAS